jgi:AmmeMemoRadiSam system protein A
MSSEEHRYVTLAREAIRHYLTTGESLDPGSQPGDPPPSGVFVSLHEPPGPDEDEGPLRGCVGSYRPRARTLRREIVQSAVAAAVSDPRFPPLRLDELDRLHITVYLLGQTEPIDSLDELDPANYGVIVEGAGGRTGLLLPAIPGITTAAEQVDIAMRKASFTPADRVRLYRFPATIIV